MSERVELVVDQRFRDYFTDLHQVFLYLTDDCDLRCRQCLYEPLLARDSQIPLPTALALITTFREMGATKLTVVGGEPTRYGHEQGYRPLLEVIRTARDLGYERIRIDTNGQFRPELLDEPDFRLLDDISFSLDGHTAAINDPLRGRGSSAKCVANLRAAVERGYRARRSALVNPRRLRRGRATSHCRRIESATVFLLICHPASCIRVVIGGDPSRPLRRANSAATAAQGGDHQADLEEPGQSDAAGAGEVEGVAEHPPHAVEGGAVAMPAAARVRTVSTHPAPGGCALGLASGREMDRRRAPSR